MWRRRSSLSLTLHQSLCYSSSSSKLPNSHLHSSFFSSSSSSSSSSSATATATATNSLDLGFPKPDVAPPFSASAAMASVNISSLASTTRHYARCYWELSKARLSMLVVATSGTGFVLGSGSAVDFAGLCWTCAGTMMVAASASSLNQVFEIKNDAKMKRTRLRPLPSERITIPHAVTWASTVGLAGTALLASKANMLAAGLAASNLILYAFVYTPMKQIHPVNTWVGAVVGAIPPLLGWAAASGQVSLNGMILPAALYFWQIPHFMALAYMCRDDYAAGGFKMYSLADASGQRTALVALRNSLYLIPLGYLAYDWGVTSGWFCLESSVLTLAISAAAFSFYRDRTAQKARRMFHASLLYLPVFMTGLLVHRLPDNEQCVKEDNSAEISSFLETKDEESENLNENEVMQSRVRKQARPPVAYASVAPFPFLPAPYTVP